MGIIYFDGKPSSDYGIVVEHYPTYTVAARNVGKEHILGRNGDILTPYNSYDNVLQTYDIASVLNKNIGASSYGDIMSKIVEWLCSSNGYCRLSDSYTPEFYRLATFNDSIEFENILNQAGRATISFDCKPKKYLYCGENKISILNNGTNINNRYYKSSDPCIYIKGTGFFTINDIDYVVKDNPGIITIDCENKTVIGNDNKNYSNKVIFGCDSEKDKDHKNPNHIFPSLHVGNNIIKYSSTITSMEVEPKWWIL